MVPSGQQHTEAATKATGAVADLTRAAVAATFMVPVNELRAATRRTAPVALARQSAMYLAHVTFGLTFTEVGRAFGRTRTTAARACHAIEDRREEARLDAALASLEEALCRDSGISGASGIMKAVGSDPSKPAVVREALDNDTINPFRAQHLQLARRLIATADGHADVVVDEAESPLAWLARRKGRDGEPLIDPVQFQAGERLRGDFTRAQMTPQVTSSWDPTVTRGRGQSGSMTFADTAVAARQQVRQALEALAPEFADLLLDVCCFLKGLEDVERERRWPPRSAKVVLQLGLDQLARHYGLTNEARGRALRADPHVARRGRCISRSKVLRRRAPSRRAHPT